MIPFLFGFVLLYIECFFGAEHWLRPLFFLMKEQKLLLFFQSIGLFSLPPPPFLICVLLPMTQFWAAFCVCIVVWDSAPVSIFECSMLQNTWTTSYTMCCTNFMKIVCLYSLLMLACACVPNQKSKNVYIYMCARSADEDVNFYEITCTLN